MDKKNDAFRLVVDPRPNASFALTVLQRPFPVFQDGHAVPFVKMGSIEGLALSAALDLVCDVLRENHHQPAVFQCDRKKHLSLSEASGVRLTVLFKALAPLSDLDHIRTLQQAIWAMSDEETYYWFAKCYVGQRGANALRVLFGVERPLASTVESEVSA